jgi:hypothetical protein
MHCPNEMEQQLEVEISFVKICLGSFVSNPREEDREKLFT